VGALQEYVEYEQERIRLEHEERRQRRIDEERIALEQRFHSGADCKWTAISRSKEQYCRVNGRAYRLTPTVDKMWLLHRIQSIEDVTGFLMGRYGQRGDATKALAKIAYEPELRR